MYHGYEWQAAAETFERLAQDLAPKQERVRCLLNAGMIRARLGDYAEASIPLDAAAKLGLSLVYTPFLIALVESELGNYIKAEACFEVCFQALRGDGVDDVGMDLGQPLDLSSVCHNIAMARAQYRRTFGAVHVGMIGISADYIFEAPPRWNTSRSLTTTPRHELAERRKSMDRMTFPKKPVERPQTALQSQTGSLHGISRPPPRTSTRSMFEVHSPSHTKGPTALLLGPRTNVSPDHGFRGDNLWKGRRRTPYTPRDARVQYVSIKELARFIRKEPLIPRDARAAPASTKELAKFIREAGCEDDNTTMPPPPTPAHRNDVSTWASRQTNDEEKKRRRRTSPHRMPSDALFHHSFLLEGFARRQTLPKRHSASAGLQIPILGGSSIELDTMSGQASPSISVETASDRRSATSSQAMQPNHFLELLPTTTYNPNTKTSHPTRPRSSTLTERWVRLKHEEHQQQDPYNPFTNLHTAASSTSSLFAGSIRTIERVDRAQQEALRVLEGQTRLAPTCGEAQKEELGMMEHAVHPTPLEPLPEADVRDGDDGDVRGTPSMVSSSRVFDIDYHVR